MNNSKHRSKRCILATNAIARNLDNDKLWSTETMSFVYHRWIKTSWDLVLNLHILGKEFWRWQDIGKGHDGLFRNEALHLSCPFYTSNFRHANAIQTIENETVDLITYYLNCIRRDGNLTYKTGHKWKNESRVYYEIHKIQQFVRQILFGGEWPT